MSHPVKVQNLFHSQGPHDWLLCVETNKMTSGKTMETVDVHSCLHGQEAGKYEVSHHFEDCSLFSAECQINLFYSHPKPTLSPYVVPPNVVFPM